MADNLGYTPGSGATVATDDVGGVHYQKMKLAFGANDSATDVSATNPFPVTNQDCVSLLSTTVSAPGVGSSIDTLGYGAVVVQISGTWQGVGYFEASNDGTNWDTVLVFSRDNLSLQDVVTSNGLYTIRPSGRYLHYVCTNITGTAAVNALGRAAEGVNASDLLSLAMDRANNTPLNVALMGTKQDAQGALMLSDASGPFYATAYAAGAAIGLLTVDTTGYKSITLSGVAGGGTFTIWGSDNNSSWAQLRGIGYTTALAQDSLTFVFTQAAPAIMQLPVLSRYIQIRCTAISTGPAVVAATLRSAPCYTFAPLTGNSRLNVEFPSSAIVNLAAGTTLAADVGIQYRANATGAATTYKFTSAASTNAALILTGARRLIGWNLTNTTAATKYFRIHNKATAPVAGTDSPLFIIAIPPNQTINFNLPGGIAITLGLGIMCTGAVADLDTTATAVGDVVGALFYS